MSPHDALVSVVIPAYNQAPFLAAAIQSVLDQTYSRFEVIVVNDASPDETSTVVKGFGDARVRLIEHQRNRGLPAARNTGIRTAAGAIVALLDADDLFHPEKLASHVAYLERHPDVEVTYNPRFNLHHSSAAVRDLWRPPLEAGLGDFVLGWPFSPSDMVIRRDALFRVGLFDEGLFSGGEDVDLPCRLALAGCRCASVNRALNYRRHHSRRRKRNLPARLQDYRDAVDRAFDHPRCPPAIRALRARAYTNHCLEVLFLAFAQHEPELGRAYVREAVRLSPELVDGEPNALMRYLVEASIADESVDHAGLLRDVLSQMPPELETLWRQYEWASRYGLLLKATRAATWADGRQDVEDLPATALRTADDAYAGWSAANFESYEIEFGGGSAGPNVRTVVRALGDAGAANIARRLEATYLINYAFRCFRAGRRDLVPRAVARAIRSHPAYLANRGVLSILARSALRPASPVHHSCPSSASHWPAA